MSDVADLLRAFMKLAPKDDATGRALIALFGFETAGVEPLPKSLPTETSAARVSQAPRPVYLRVSELEAEAKPPESRSLPFRMRAIADVRRDRPDWVSAHAPFERSRARFEPVIDPLLEPKQARAIVSSALSTLSAEGPVEVRDLLRLAANRQPIRRLVRRKLPTLARGVEVLLDRGEAMIAFMHDETPLLDALERTIGHELIRIAAFHGTPLRGIHRFEAEPGEAATSWIETRPAPGAAVLVVSDLGLGRASRLGDRCGAFEEWLAFARLARTASCPVVALVPHARTRYPDPVRRAMTVLTWDRTTTASVVRTLVGRGLQVPGWHG
jgi:hypothetical protein